MKSYKYILTFFSASAFIANFFLVFLTGLAVLIVQSNIPMLFYLLGMIPVGYGFFDVFREYGERKYVLGATAASTSMALMPLTVYIVLNFFSGVGDTLSAFLPISTLEMLNPSLLFVSMLVFFNLTALGLYHRRKGIENYEILAFYLIPIIIYFVPVLL